MDLCQKPTADIIDLTNGVTHTTISFKDMEGPPRDCDEMCYTDAALCTEKAENETYKKHSEGVAGQTERWDIGGAKGKGVAACYKAVMADKNCHKQYFTYVERGDENCGCTSDSRMKIRIEPEGDVYEILNSGTQTTACAGAAGVATKMNDARRGCYQKCDCRSIRITNDLLLTYNFFAAPSHKAREFQSRALSSSFNPILRGGDV